MRYTSCSRILTGPWMVPRGRWCKFSARNSLTQSLLSKCQASHLTVYDMVRKSRDRKRVILRVRTATATSWGQFSREANGDRAVALRTAVDTFDNCSTPYLCLRNPANACRTLVIHVLETSWVRKRDNYHWYSPSFVYTVSNKVFHTRSSSTLLWDYSS